MTNRAEIRTLLDVVDELDRLRDLAGSLDMALQAISEAELLNPLARLSDVVLNEIGALREGVEAMRTREA